MLVCRLPNVAAENYNRLEALSRMSETIVEEKLTAHIAIAQKRW